MRRASQTFPAALAVLVGLVSPAGSTTLEKLSLETLIDRSTAIIRGKATSCAASLRGRTIYTVCDVAVSERLKGGAGAAVAVATLGGTLNGVRQAVAGAPRIEPGQEYLFFLWTGRSGLTQVIGLSQGIFDLRLLPGGVKIASRAASSEVMLNSAGQRVQEEPFSMSYDELAARIRTRLQGARD
ncbi:MAG: hypothetical protein FJW40_15585 [Acidobacteria bacterium]|nr:hypothetical protein [Acidobacteriota bacterium]